MAAAVVYIGGNKRPTKMYPVSIAKDSGVVI